MFRKRTQLFLAINKCLYAWTLLDANVEWRYAIPIFLNNRVLTRFYNQCFVSTSLSFYLETMSQSHPLTMFIVFLNTFILEIIHLADKNPLWNWYILCYVAWLRFLRIRSVDFDFIGWRFFQCIFKPTRCRKQIA